MATIEIRKTQNQSQALTNDVESQKIETVATQTQEQKSIKPFFLTLLAVSMIFGGGLVLINWLDTIDAEKVVSEHGSEIAFSYLAYLAGLFLLYKVLSANSETPNSESPSLPPQ